MQFMIMRKADDNTEAGVMPSEELIAAMGRFNEEMVKAGVMLGGDGLKPTSQGFRVQFKEGVPTVTDGPFTETKELLAGYTMIKVNSREEALAWAKRWPAVDLERNVTLEVRPVYTLEDFTPGEGIEIHKAYGEKLARRPSLMCSYLMFNGRCKEAFEFYANVFGSQIEMCMTHSDSPMCEEVPATWKDKVMHAQIRIGDWILMGTDVPPDMYVKPVGISVQMSIDDLEQAQKVFTALAESGTVHMPFAETFWARGFGACSDRFDIPWMINCMKPMPT